MNALFWNVAIVWSTCAVLGIEYCANLMEREKQREPIAPRRRLPSKLHSDRGE